MPRSWGAWTSLLQLLLALCPISLSSPLLENHLIFKAMVTVGSLQMRALTLAESGWKQAGALARQCPRCVDRRWAA